MFIALYFHAASGLIVIPAQAKTKAGLYLEAGSIERASIQDSEAVCKAALRIWQLGCSIVSTPDRSAFPKKPPYDLPGVRTWNDLERSCTLWHLEQRPDGSFEIEQWISPPREQGFVPSRESREVFDPGTQFCECIRRICKRMQQTELDEPS